MAKQTAAERQAAELAAARSKTERMAALKAEYDQHQDEYHRHTDARAAAERQARACKKRMEEINRQITAIALES